MRRPFVKVLLAVSSFSTMLAGSPPPDSVFRMALILNTASEPSRLMTSAMKRDLQAIFSFVPIEFDVLNEGAPLDANAYLLVVPVQLNGACRTSEDRSTTTLVRGLGSVVVDRSPGAKEITVGCDPIWVALRRSVANPQSVVLEAAIGRAVARVIAHELFHMLPNRTVHSRSGLGRRLLSPADLTMPVARFDPASQQIIRAALLHRALAMSVVSHTN